MEVTCMFQAQEHVWQTMPHEGRARTGTNHRGTVLGKMKQFSGIAA